MLTEEFKKNGVPYAVVRARTADNPYLAPGQLKLLRMLYTEDEARAFLDGEFVNLSQGRVYAEFNPAKHIYMPFPIAEGKRVYHSDGSFKGFEGGDTIYVGQDFNSGYNAAVIVIERAGNLHVVTGYHWDYVGQGATKLREMYPNNRIILIPDANGKEIMSGFTEEFEEQLIEIFWNNVNPSVTERITAINKAFRFGQLFIHQPSSSQNESMDRIIMCLQTRDFDDNGKPRKGKGPNAVDHWGDALEYAVWHIIHQINGFDKILEAIRAVHHVKSEMAKEVA